LQSRIYVERDLLQWLVRYGAVFLFFAQVFGIIGLPIPDELLLTIAGALIAQGKLHTGTTVFAAMAGCLTGITVSYFIGRVLGVTVLKGWFGRHQWAVDRAHRWFRRFGAWLLAFGYFIPGVRHLTAISAGTGCLEYRVFAAYAYPGGMLWCAVFLGLGYYAGDRWHEVAAAAQSHVAIVALAAVGLITLFILVRSRMDREQPELRP
jgi:membrane protein DedA with SNARE-associated domain